MGKFYLETTDIDPDTGKFVIYELSATSGVGITLPSKTTDYAIEKGDDVTDNVVVKNRKLQMQGILTDVSQASFSVIGSAIDLITKSVQRGGETVFNTVDDVENYIKQIETRI